MRRGEGGCRLLGLVVRDEGTTYGYGGEIPVLGWGRGTDASCLHQVPYSISSIIPYMTGPCCTVQYSAEHGAQLINSIDAYHRDGYISKEITPPRSPNSIHYPVIRITNIGLVSISTQFREKKIMIMIMIKYPNRISRGIQKLPKFPSKTPILPGDHYCHQYL